jgi:hypothetical protein
MYHDPKTVLSPRDRVKSVEVVYDAGPVDGSWSVAQLEWGDSSAVGIRWNGNPTWFVVPKELENAVLNAAQEWNRKKQKNLAEGYRQMAADRARETEAEEWTEAFIGDID